MSDGKIKLPRSSYEEIVKIVRGYARQDKPVFLSEISKLTGMGETMISANVSFLSNIGLIEGAQAKKATSIGTELGRSLEHGLGEAIENSWESVVKQSEFLSKMVTAVTIRNGMEVSSLEAHIAYSAGEAKAKHVATGAKAVIDILKASGLVIQDGDRILPAKKESLPLNKSVSKVESSMSPASASVESRPVTISASSYAPGVNINIEIQVQAKVDELDNLGAKLSKLLSDLSKPGPTNDGEQ